MTYTPLLFRSMVGIGRPVSLEVEEIDQVTFGTSRLRGKHQNQLHLKLSIIRDDRRHPYATLITDRINPSRIFARLRVVVSKIAVTFWQGRGENF